MRLTVHGSSQLCACWVCLPHSSTHNLEESVVGIFFFFFVNVIFTYNLRQYIIVTTSRAVPQSVVSDINHNLFLRQMLIATQPGELCCEPPGFALLQVRLVIVIEGQLFFWLSGANLLQTCTFSVCASFHRVHTSFADISTFCLKLCNCWWHPRQRSARRQGWFLH